MRIVEFYINNQLADLTNQIMLGSGGDIFKLGRFYDRSRQKYFTLKERLERRLSVLQPWRYSYIDWFYTQPAVELLKQILQDLKPSIVVFEHLWLCRYLRVVQGYPCKIIFDES